MRDAMSEVAPLIRHGGASRDLLEAKRVAFNRRATEHHRQAAWRRAVGRHEKL